MKNKLLFSTLLFVACTLSINVNAQLKVETSGDVVLSKTLKVSKEMAVGANANENIALNIYKMGTFNAEPTYGIVSNVKLPQYPVYTLYGIYADANALNATAVYYPYPIVGVYGTFKKGEGLATFAAGVAGVAHHRGGVGVFGGINSLPTGLPASAKYAGLFKGTTKVDGTLLATTFVLDGDTLNIQNIRSLTRNTSNSITQLRPVSYSFKSDSTLQYDEKLQREMEGTHYGFIAQDVQKILPELVYEREGELSVNYIEMIPLLLQEIQRLSAEVEELKKQKK